MSCPTRGNELKEIAFSIHWCGQCGTLDIGMHIVPRIAAVLKQAGEDLADVEIKHIACAVFSFRAETNGSGRLESMGRADTPIAALAGETVMPKGLRGYRWISTGRHVWMLEDRPRHFLGCVSYYGDGDYRWHMGFGGGGVQGEARTKREAMDEVERRAIPERRGDVQVTMEDLT